MTNKIEELTKKIYNEGIEKAKEEADRIIKNAKNEADSLIKDAEKKADEIKKSAADKKQELIRNTESEIKMTSQKVISEIKQKVTTLVTSKVVKGSLDGVVDDKDLVKKVITTLAGNWNPASGEELNLNIVLPEAFKNELNGYFESLTFKNLKEGMTVNFDNSFKSGFKIGPGDNSYILSFTDEDFISFFKNYLRPKTVELLYGKGE